MLKFKTIEKRTPEFHIKNEVFVNSEFNLNIEVMRYLLIKEKMSPENQKFIIRGLNNMKDGFVGDTFLFTVESKNEYNIQVLEILKELQEYRNSKNDTLEDLTSISSKIHINIKQDAKKFTNFSLTYGTKKVFNHKLYYTKFNQFKMHKYRMFAALLRYDILGFLTGNLTTAVRPEIYKELKEKGYNCELYASFYNCYMNNYFGLFYDLEYPFGCLGNILTSKLIHGKFVANPPFTIRDMNSMVSFLLENFKNKLPENNIEVYITVPVWYKEDREKLGKMESYGQEFRKDLLKPYIIKDTIYLQKDYKFFNYIYGKELNVADINVFEIKA